MLSILVPFFTGIVLYSPRRSWWSKWIACFSLNGALVGCCLIVASNLCEALIFLSVGVSCKMAIVWC